VSIIKKILHILIFITGTSAYADNPLNQQIENDIEEYQKLVEQSFSYREQTILTYRKLKNNLDEDIPLSGKDIETLNEGLNSHLQLRKKFYQVVYYYEYLLEKEKQEIDMETQLKGIMLSLSAALILYDNYLLSVSVFEDDSKLRRYLNSNKKGYGIDSSQLTKITVEYNSTSNRQRVRNAMAFFKENWKKQKYEFKNQESNAYLHALITNSPSYNSTLSFSPLYVISRHVKFLTGITVDTLNDLSTEGINLFSLLFGNSVGIITTRKGLLHKNELAHNDLHDQLKAGDILLEKTPFRLTDKLIPGYWGHVAIWIGSKEELIDLGVWDHPVVKKYQGQIQSKQLVAEALRSGVVLNSLETFLNVDDLAVLRKNTLSNQERAKIIVRSLRQIGKPYDFNFDIESNDRIVCSELIYVVYTDTQWPTESTIGRHTISPTNIAEKAGHDKPFEIVSLYLQGKPVKDKIQSIFKKLN